MECIEAWKDAIGAEHIISVSGSVVKNENPDIRTPLLEWIIKNKEAIAQSEAEELVSPLIACLQDKMPAIRSLTEEVVIEVMKVVPYSRFSEAVQDLKPAVKQTMKKILKQCKEQAGGEDDDDEPMEEVKAEPVSSMSKTVKPVKKPLTKRPVTSKPAKPARPTGRGKKGEEEESGLTILDMGNKDKRNVVDTKAKWTPEEIRPDYI